MTDKRTAAEFIKLSLSAAGLLKILKKIIGE